MELKRMSMAIQSIKDFHRKHQTTSGRDYRKAKCIPSYSEIIILFGSWEQALASAGINMPERPARLNPFEPKQVMTREEAAAVLKMHLSEDHKLFFMSEYAASGRHPSVNALSYVFGTWRKAMQYLGIDVDRPGLKGRSAIRFEVAKEVVDEAKKNW